MKSWWAGLQVRERRLLSIAAAMMIALLFWLLVLRPLAAAREQSHSAVETLRQTLGEISGQVDAILATKVLAAPRPVRSLFALVDSSARQAGLMTAQTRVEPLSENEVRITLDAVDFNQLAAWLEGLDRDEGVDISEWSVDRALVPGVVNAAVTVKASR
jgi:general secretion pathway protein M